MPPPVQTPRHVRAIDFAAARATEVRRPPVPPPPPSFPGFCFLTTTHALSDASLSLFFANEDSTTHPAKLRTDTMAIRATVR
jgi:hypothetical protein